jgi:5'-nucleotidase
VNDHNDHLDTSRLVVAISSRALFDLSESHRVFETEGLQAYCNYQITHEDDLLDPGVAFPLVRKLLQLNVWLDDKARVEVIMVSRNSADTGLRVFDSIERHGLDITRAAFTRGASPYRYVSAFGAHLFLSTDPEDVRKALEAGYAAATILPSDKPPEPIESPQLRIAFDGDAVLFSDEAERVYRQEGLDAFSASEKAAARTPLSGGPFMAFLAALHHIQSLLPETDSPLRTALITARGAPAHERVIRTLRAWQIRIDEAFFLGGLDKSAFLRAFGADIFFDDQQVHCVAASRHVPTGHVPGVTHDPSSKISDEVSPVRG